MSKAGNKTVSRKQIPFKYRASRPKIVQWLARWFLRIFGWKVEGVVPPTAGNENLILIAGPHTSNWDGVFGIAAILGLDAKITFFGKYTLFNKPVLGRFLKYMGGIPVDKSKPGRGLTDMAIENMKKLNGSLIAMSPEGTRSKVEEWKTGFLRIAKEINAHIIPASLDFSKKEIILGDAFVPSGDNMKDIQDLKQYYSVFTAKHPEKY